jgi:hypothetical protein
MSRRAASFVAFVVLGGLALVPAAVTPAHARDNGTGADQDGNVEGSHDGAGVLSAEATATEIVVTGDTGGDGGNLEPLDTSWTPPVCWYEPWLTAQEFADAVEAMAAENGRANRALNINSPHEAFTDIYRDNNPEDWAYNLDSRYAMRGYDNYNLDAEEDGLWWRPVINPNREDEYRAGTDCVEPIFWGDPVEVPDLDEAITDEMLAEYAYDEIDIPETEIELSPSGDQIVNLPTWIWMQAADLEPRTVRAELPINGVWAETTAEPVSLTIDAGTEDAQLFPSSGECALRDDGRIGEPWDESREGEDPPCGLTYLRSTHGTGPYELTASLTWEVYWTGSQTEGRNPLPGGTFETTQTIVVEESQTIVR